MALTWNDAGDRFYEAGLDRGVLYPDGEDAVVWNGLVAVAEDPIGGEAVTSFYDGFNYQNSVNREHFQATLTAYTYPSAFSRCDGTARVGSGLYATHQSHKNFGLTYRTMIGNDIKGIDRGYKLHLIYNCTAVGKGKGYRTINDQIDPTLFEWQINAVPIKIPGYRETAHFIFDTTKAPAFQVDALERILYGANPRLPTWGELERIINSEVYEIQQDTTDGLSPLLEELPGDVIGWNEQGLYTEVPEGRLVETNTYGIYEME